MPQLYLSQVLFGHSDALMQCMTYGHYTNNAVATEFNPHTLFPAGLCLLPLPLTTGSRCSSELVSAAPVSDARKTVHIPPGMIF